MRVTSKTDLLYMEAYFLDVNMPTKSKTDRYLCYIKCHVHK